jgi:hypothetical protein
MTVKITDEELKKIILEETKQVLKENPAAAAGAVGLLSRGASLLKKPIMNGLKKALGSLKRTPKIKPKAPKAAPGFGKFKAPKGAPAGGLATLGAAAQKDPSMLILIAGALTNPFGLGPKAWTLGLLASVAWELIDDLIDLFKVNYDAEDVAGADMMAYSNAVEQKYITFLTKAGELLVIPANPGVVKQLLGAIYVAFLSLPYKVGLTVLSLGIPMADIFKTDPDILGFFKVLNQNLMKERKRLLDDIGDIVEMYGPLEMGTAKELFKVNKRRNPAKMRAELIKIIDATVFEQVKRARASDVPTDPSSSKPDVIKAMDDFLRALNNYEKAIPDEILDRAQKVGVPKRKPVTTGAPADTDSPSSSTAPAVAAPMSKRILMKRVEATLRDNGVRDPAQREGWVSWANTTRQSGLASEDRVVSFMDKWFGSVRANVLEENRELFTEVKLYTCPRRVNSKKCPL